MVSPLRVWEETWLFIEPTEDREPMVETWSGGVLTEAVPGDRAPESTARLRLASKAPELVRTLMTLAGMGTDPYCNGCGDTSKRGHERGCALVKLLYEAGVGTLHQADRSVALKLVQP